MAEITDDQLELARTVAEDLEHLMDEWEPKLHPVKLRQLSPQIRRLLIYGDYGKAWRALGLEGEPYVTASSLDAMLGTIERRHIVVAFAPPGPEVGMAMQAGGEVKLHTTVPLPEGAAMMIAMTADWWFGPLWVAVPSDELSPIVADRQKAMSEKMHTGLGRRQFRGMPLSAYLESPAAVVGETPIKRRDVISYVANKLGGAHFDASRDGKNDSRMELLDSHPAQFVPKQGPKVTLAYIELFSVCEAIVESSDAARFRNELAKLERTLAAQTNAPAEGIA